MGSEAIAAIAQLVQVVLDFLENDLSIKDIDG